MMSNFVELEIKDRQELNDEILPSGEWVLAELGIDPTALKSIKMPPWQRSHYRAIINWLTKYKSQPDAPNIKKIWGYLQAFYHLCEIEAWKEASQIISVPLNNSTKIFVEQLIIWGYGREVVSLCNKLLNKLSLEKNYTVNSLISIALLGLGQYSKALDFRQNALQISSKIEDRLFEADCLIRMGTIYLSQYQPNLAVQLSQQGLEMLQTQENIDMYIDLKYLALTNLGYSYCILRQPKGINYLNQVAEWAVSNGDSASQAEYIGILGTGYLFLNRFKKADNQFQQSYNLCKEIGFRHGECIMLFRLGLTAQSLGKFRKAIDYYEQSLEIAREIGDKGSEAMALFNLGSSYPWIGKFREASAASKKAKQILQEINFTTLWENQIAQFNQTSMNLIECMISFSEWLYYWGDEAFVNFILKVAEGSGLLHTVLVQVLTVIYTLKLCLQICVLLLLTLILICLLPLVLIVSIIWRRLLAVFER